MENSPLNGTNNQQEVSASPYTDTRRASTTIERAEPASGNKSMNSMIREVKEACKIDRVSTEVMESLQAIDIEKYYKQTEWGNKIKTLQMIVHTSISKNLIFGADFTIQRGKIQATYHCMMRSFKKCNPNSQIILEEWYKNECEHATKPHGLKSDCMPFSKINRERSQMQDVDGVTVTMITTNPGCITVKNSSFYTTEFLLQGPSLKLVNGLVISTKTNKEPSSTAWQRMNDGSDRNPIAMLKKCAGSLFIKHEISTKLVSGNGAEEQAE